MAVDMLAKQNPHERDAHISFEEGPHIYTIDGESDFMSVTTWNHSHFAEFNADAIITNMMNGRKWAQSKYYGMTREEIKAQWEANRAGSIDMVYENPDGTLMIYDWKRSKGIHKTSSFMKFSHTHCIEHIPDTNFWHYSLQLNTYKALIEKNYGKTVTSMVLVCLYPENKSYQLLKVPDLSEEVADLFNLRRYTLDIKANNNL